MCLPRGGSLQAESKGGDVMAYDRGAASKAKKKPKPIATYEEEERIAIEQESSGEEIDVVRRDAATGELKPTTEGST